MHPKYGSHRWSSTLCTSRSYFTSPCPLVGIETASISHFLSQKQGARVSSSHPCALFYPSQAQVLPCLLLRGYLYEFLLEARLNATSSGIAPFVEGMRPELHFSRLLGQFRKAGLDRTYTRTFAGSVHAPLSDEIRSALTALIEMRWIDVQAEL